MKKILTTSFLLVVVFFVFAYGVSYRLWHRDRFTIAVNGKQPAIFSLSPRSGIVTVVLFDPTAYVEVPGGYKWYKLGNVQLLGKIDGKEAGVMQRTYESLIGAPVHMVALPSRVTTDVQMQKDGISWLLQNRSFLISIIGNSTTLSRKNPFDIWAAMQVLGARKDKLLIIDARALTYKDKDQKRYNQEALDTRLRGYFYMDALAKELTIRIHAPKGKGIGADRIARLIEGSGIKVLSVQYGEKPNTSACVFVGSSNAKEEVSDLMDHWKCGFKDDERTAAVVDFYPGDSLATLYQ